MTFLPKLIYWETLLFLVGLLTIVAGRLISGGINTSNLLHGRNANGTLYLSPERVQLLLLTLATAFQYVSAFLHNPTIFLKYPALGSPYWDQAIWYIWEER